MISLNSDLSYVVYPLILPLQKKKSTFIIILKADCKAR